MLFDEMPGHQRLGGRRAEHRGLIGDKTGESFGGEGGLCQLEDRVVKHVDRVAATGTEGTSGFPYDRVWSTSMMSAVRVLGSKGTAITRSAPAASAPLGSPATKAIRA